MKTLQKWIAGLLLGIAGSAGLAYAQNIADVAPLSFDPNRDVPVDTALPIGIVGWWRLDEAKGLSASDAAGTNTGRLVGFTTPRWSQGQLGRALAFDGASGNAVVIPSVPMLNPDRQASLSAWIYSNTAGSAGPETIISKDGAEFSQYSLRIEGAGRLRFAVGNTNLTIDARMAPNAWNHVVASFDGNVMRLFVNGVAAPRTIERPGAMQTTENPVRIGSGADARQPQAFNGLLDDVRIYRRGLNFVDAASLYREGIENSHSTFINHLHVSQYGGVYKVDNADASQVQPGLLQPWWQAYREQIASDSESKEALWEHACGTGVEPTGKLLICFLQSYSKLSASIVWQDADPATHVVTDLKYTQWSPARKKDLYRAFFHAFQWMKGGLQTFGGTTLVDPPVNQIHLPDAAPFQTALDPDAAWQLYVNTVAHSLAVEVGGFVPWSVTGYSTPELHTLFHSKYMFDAGWGNSWANYPDPKPYFGYQPAGDTMEAPPTMFFQFMVDKNIIRGNHETTIEQLIDWSRFHLLHILNWTDISALAFEGWWDYRGSSPASRVLSGTIGLYKPLPGYPSYSHNWVYGCHGVVTLYRGLLRTVNIPVDYRIEFGHGMPIWHTVNKSLSHGDDVELFIFKTGSVNNDPSTWAHWYKYAKASEYPITLTQFRHWFEGPNKDQLNVGRRIYDLLTIKYPEDDMLDRYCYDKAHGLNHANGTVLASLQGSGLLQLYPLAKLEAKGFWTTLSSESAQFGVCGP